jgi:hypothetical protein
MYESLSVHISDFHLFIFAFDELSNRILLNLSLDKVTIVSLDEFETEELKKVKKERSKAEYCWTCTPSIISYVFEKYNVQDCTYLDSDLLFYSDPSILISEMYQHDKNVLITEHRFSCIPRLYEEKRAGRFCVQFMTFVNEKSSLIVLDKWRKQCINWCYARYEEGRFGDQKYLDDWPSAYQNIHILVHQGGGIAPWNLGKYVFKKDKNLITGKVKRTGSIFEIVFFHFQYVKFLEDGSFDVGWYLIPTFVKNIFYKPYIKNIVETESRLQNKCLYYRTGFTKFKVYNFKDFLKARLKNNLGYNIINV